MNGDTAAAAAAWRWAEALGAWAWRASWQGAALAAVVALLLWAVGRRIPPGWRFGLWALVLLRLAMPAIVPMDLGRSEKQVAHGDAVIVPARPAQPKTAGSRDPVPDWKEGEVAAIVEDDAKVALPAVTESDSRATATIVAAWQASKRYVIGAWLAGILILGIRITWSSVRLARSVRRMPLMADARLSEILAGCCHELAIRRRPLARELPVGGGAPALVGFVRPAVLLPAHLVARLPDEELRLILMHELAHVKRGDVLINWLGTLVAVLHWPNPAAWGVLWRMRAERELACDELVLRRQGGSGAAYARTILGLVEAMSSSVTSGGAAGGRVPAAGALTVPAGAVGIIEGKAQIQRRLLMIAKFDATTGWRRPAVAAAVTLFVGAMALAGATRAADPHEAPAAPATPVAKPKPERTTKAVESKATTTATPAITLPLRPASDPAAGAPAVPGAPGLPGAGRPGPIHVGGGGSFEATPASPEDDAANARTAEKLRKPIGKVDFNEVPLRDVIDFLRDGTGVDILVQWNALDEVGVPRDVPITLHLREPMPADGVMTMIFKSASLPLRYELEKGVVVIGPSAARGAVITRVYDVSDLVAQTPVLPPPGSFGGGGGGGVGGGGLGGEGSQPPSPTDVDQLMKLITSTASPETWRDAGGDIGAIAFFKNKLVIKTTEPIHKEVSSLLEMLREKPAAKAKEKVGH